MAEDKSATPEQQLLKLIEGQTRPGEAPPGAAKQPKGRGLPMAGLRGKILASLAFWKRGVKKKARGGRASFGIAEVNKALVVASAVLFLYVVFDAAASARNLQRPPNFSPLKDMKPKAAKETVAPLAETSYYLQKVSSRDIFKEGKREAAPVEEAPAAKGPAETADEVKGLSLVGISWSSNPDAIIEDKARQRTYFVKRGQEAGDGVKVEAIFRDHVVVTFEDREYELR